MKFYSFFYAKSLAIFFFLLSIITLTTIILIPYLYELTLYSEAKGKTLLNT